MRRSRCCADRKVSELAKELGVSEQTFRNWRKQQAVERYGWGRT